MNMFSGPIPAGPEPSPAPVPETGSGARRLSPAILGGLAGAVFLMVATSFASYGSPSGYLDLPGFGSVSDPGNLHWPLLIAPAVAIALGLCLLRWWPYLLMAAVVMLVPTMLEDFQISILHDPYAVVVLQYGGYYLAIVALLGCAQGLVGTMRAWGAVIAALALGSRMAGSLTDQYGNWLYSSRSTLVWHVVLVGLAAAALIPAVWRYRRGDPAVASVVGGWSWRRGRVLVAGVLAACMPIPVAFLTTDRVAALLGVSESAVFRHSDAQTAIIGLFILLTVAVLAGIAGLWSLGGALTAAVIQVAIAAPMLLAASALVSDNPVRWAAALGGAALGALAAASRWRFHLAASLTLLAVVTLFIAYGATTGDPEKLAQQHTVIPAVLILVLCVASAGAITGAIAPVLGSRGTLPIVLGPLAEFMAVGALDTTAAANGVSGSYVTTEKMIIAVVLLLLSGAAVSGLGFAQLLATRRAERKHAEQIRLEAAAAERDRLARPIHDGVLQVLALVQRHGSELGGQGSELAALAGEQEVALRSLLAGGKSNVRAGAVDLRTPLQALATSVVDVVTPVQAVAWPADAAAELLAAVRAALDNVRQHAGAEARTWILLEEEPDGVRVTVRDDGVGFPPQRPAEAAEAGRLGITQSMRGRIADLGGDTTIESRPGEGTEVEFWVPRERSGKR
ncbi:sensor histidine kinase [Actinospica robiniae]|uniref:sensor histidine kinase n=1 Tax=Actinospica robiniae TaxID=304901 RepID=UPI0012FBF7C2|nr:ATP-binding protein [Actinospica robiniae]